MEKKKCNALIPAGVWNEHNHSKVQERSLLKNLLPSIINAKSSWGKQMSTSKQKRSCVWNKKRVCERSAKWYFTQMQCHWSQSTWGDPGHRHDISDHRAEGGDNYIWRKKNTVIPACSTQHWDLHKWIYLEEWQRVACSLWLLHALPSQVTWT